MTPPKSKDWEFNPDNPGEVVDFSDAAMFTIEKAKELLLKSGELVEPRSYSGFIVGGVIVGVGLGAAGGYFFARRRLETKYNQIAEEAIAEMREHYQNKILSLENTTQKPDLEDVVREQGYSQPPMAVTPPSTVVEAAEAEQEEDSERPTEPEPVGNQVRNVFQEAQVNDNWDFHAERTRRSPMRPYIIHRDEREEQQAYDEVTYTYYEDDDVLCNERDEVIGKDQRDMLIGEKHLGQFGHGSGDASIVYIRNDRLEMQMEIVRSPNSYAEEVHGFRHTDNSVHRRRTRRSFDDE
jgi:hypothetical protein